MIHDLDLALSLARTEVSGVSACGFRVLTNDIDIATARIEFANGCVADLSASRVSQAVVRKFRVFEPGLYASADLQAGKLRYVRQEGGEIKETEETHAGGDALAAQAESFRSCCHGRSTGRGRRRGGPPRAQARPRDRTPGARAPGALQRMNKPIQMVDPAGEYRSLKAEIDAAVGRVFGSGRFVLGPEGEALEREIAQFVGAAHAVGCNSGTDALHFPLVAAGIGPGDEVVIPGFTFFATGEAVSYTGATPVFADVEEGTFNLDPASLREKITTKTKAVIAVHLFGQCANLEEIARICKEKKLLLVEDCAQCIGADYQGKRAGSWGDFGGFSFYPTKNLGRGRRRRPDHRERPSSMPRRCACCATTAAARPTCTSAWAGTAGWTSCRRRCCA